MPRWVVLLLLARASGAEGPRVVFVAADAERGKWGTFAHRGVSNADLLNASTALCASVASDFDVYVHVKYPCARALDFPGRRGHVYDVLDQKNENFLRDARLHAVVFASDWDLRRRCARPICAAIPHHFNLPCAPVLNGTRVGVVGTAWGPKPDVRDALEKRLALKRETLVFEEAGKPCAFFDRLRVALAWHPDADVDTSITVYQMEKPAERFTNPIVLGIPTIGYRGYPSYAEYDPDEHFLCDTVKCVREVIRKLDGGQLRSEFAALRARVLDDVSSQANALRYRTLIQSVTAAVNARGPTRQWRLLDPGLELPAGSGRLGA